MTWASSQDAAHRVRVTFAEHDVNIFPNQLAPIHISFWCWQSGKCYTMRSERTWATRKDLPVEDKDRRGITDAKPVEMVGLFVAIALVCVFRAIWVRVAQEDTWPPIEADDREINVDEANVRVELNASSEEDVRLAFEGAANITQMMIRVMDWGPTMTLGERMAGVTQMLAQGNAQSPELSHMLHRAAAVSWTMRDRGRSERLNMAHHLSSHFAGHYMVSHNSHASITSNEPHSQLHAAAVGQAVRSHGDITPQMEQDIAQHLVDNFASVAAAQETSNISTASGPGFDQPNAGALVIPSEGSQSMGQSSAVDVHLDLLQDSANALVSTPSDDGTQPVDASANEWPQGMTSSMPMQQLSGSIVSSSLQSHVYVEPLAPDAQVEHATQPHMQDICGEQHLSVHEYAYPNLTMQPALVMAPLFVPVVEMQPTQLRRPTRRSGQNRRLQRQNQASQ